MIRDKGIVISSEKEIAQVEVDCLSSCQECSAHTFCIGNNRNPGLVSAVNLIHASPGDCVAIDIPESRYNRALIILFGTALAALLVGIAIGYWTGPFLALSHEAGSVLGLALGLLISALALSRYFKKANKGHLFPRIVEITRKGDCHG